MKKMGNHHSILRKFLFGFATILAFSVAVQAQDAAKGKELFNTNCAACHALDSKMVGPALRGVATKYEKDWLYKWINNSAALIASGDATAVKVYEENGKIPMTAFPQLTPADIDNILAYTSEPIPAPEPEVVPIAPKEEGLSNNVILGFLTILMALLIVLLLVVNNMLRKIAVAKDVDLEGKGSLMSLCKAYAKNQALVVATAILLLLASTYFLYGYLMQIGVDQNYEPIQPIHYSHKIHAGDNGIDCKYCHSSARVSKNAGIPSLNVCMNCHKNISEFKGDKDSVYAAPHDKAFYSGEIQKLYDAVGWDKAAGKYTGKTKPVKWVRIHNLPDFAYFNHSQHVTVGGVECQKCHGPVETYEVMKQFAPLTMGWCINCHRETGVKTENNEYYKKIHAQLSKKLGKEKLTVADMGGLECGKCHY